MCRGQLETESSRYLSCNHGDIDSHPLLGASRKYLEHLDLLGAVLKCLGLGDVIAHQRKGVVCCIPYTPPSHLEIRDVSLHRL